MLYIIDSNILFYLSYRKEAKKEKRTRTARRPWWRVASSGRPRGESITNHVEFIKVSGGRRRQPRSVCALAFSRAPKSAPLTRVPPPRERARSPRWWACFSMRVSVCHCARCRVCSVSSLWCDVYSIEIFIKTTTFEVSTQTGCTFLK